MTLLNCPDVMSNVIEEPLLSKWEILSFAQKHSIYNINLWNGQHFQYGRSEMKTSCEKYPDLGLSPTCIEVSNDNTRYRKKSEHAYHNKFFVDTF